MALCLSAFFTALGGSLYAQKELYIDPGSVLSTALSIKMALVSILGGVGTLVRAGDRRGHADRDRGAARASIFGGSGRGTDTVIYAALIIVVAVFYPSGIVGWLGTRACAGAPRRRARRARPPRKPSRRRRSAQDAGAAL